ncbi:MULTISPECIES: hypothetical protein [Eubacteriales]|mgnify:FL=1|uniref:hypothetical protein n=1 Tax=Eubacteriales TaxID=186802 RepID=UPI0011073E2F|nr:MULTISPECIES: hypothetical protein [Eubacteriales]
MFTQEQNEEIRKVINVFDDYIRETPYFDLVWSDKLGYVMLNGITDDGDDFYIAPAILRDGATLFDHIIRFISTDLMKREGKPSDLTLCGTAEQQEIRDTLSPYTEQLPEYGYLVDELFAKYE